MTDLQRPTLTRRSLTALALVTALAPLAGRAQGFPSKLITLYVPFPPGGPTDTASRIVGQKLGEILKQTVIVENRPGASGSIAATALARMPADGHSLMMLATPTLLATRTSRPWARPTTCPSWWW
jgi:tripartite-type tricarboxylate transporter receptor subunit TctC